jgi:hypothetical protein
MFSERNSEALNAADNAEYGSVIQDDYDTWWERLRWCNGAGASTRTKAGYGTTDTTGARTTFTQTAMWKDCDGAKRGTISFPIIK